MDAGTGNILGNPRAEADRLLEKTFLATSDYRALTETEDFHVVVGRRGTGKSALFAKVRDHMSAQSKLFVHAEIPQEHHALTLQALLERARCNYRTARASCRLLWRGHILSLVATSLVKHYKVRESDAAHRLESLLARIPAAATAYEFAVKTLSPLAGTEATRLPGAVADSIDLDTLQALTSKVLTDTHRKAVLLFDSLDEGWEPAEVPTALLGGLALAASELADAHTNVNVIAFVRDNMFRALAHFDPDFSRHIEGSDLRIRWDEGSLFHLVTQRIRAAFNVDAENDSKVWARFAQRGLEGRAGFDRCLQHTLYRPRDVLVLLNKSYQIAERDARQQIVDTDVEAAAKIISTDRLGDLYKEYDTVLPGLRLFASMFHGTKAVWRYDELLSQIKTAMTEQHYLIEDASDFAILSSDNDVFLALYSVGFLGLQRDAAGPYVFCHDGAPSDTHAVPAISHVAIHPCYWRALDVSDSAPSIDVLAHVHDDYQPVQDSAVKDLRMQRLGQVVEELPKLSEGDEQAPQFEEWVLRATKILFSGHLSNLELHPNGEAVQRRDVVGTNTARDGFWRRIYEDYCSRQVVFEVKNYSAIKLEDIRQCLSYSGKEYGAFILLVHRGTNEGVAERERQWLQEMYNQHGVVVLLLPATILARCLSKYRTHRRSDYWDEHLGKRLDTHLRSYLSIKSGRIKAARAKASS